MRRKLLSISILAILLPFTTIAQDTIPDLIFSEARLDGHPFTYFELSNVGDTALDLSDFLLQGIPGPIAIENLMYFPDLILPAGASYVVSNTYEELPKNWSAINKVSDRLIYQWEEGELFDSGVLIDSIGPSYSVTRVFGGKYGIILWYKYNETDSVIIDCVNYNLVDGVPTKVDGGLPIAGVVAPVNSYTMVRKSNTAQGNLGNWDASRGVDAEDSEWILLEHYNVFNISFKPGFPFRTVGNHGDFPFSVTGAGPGVTVNLNNSTLTVPWGIYKSDSLVEELNYGDGMAWWYLEKPSFEDSVHSIIQTGDSLIVKACGTQLVQQTLGIHVSDPPDNMNLVFPRRRIKYPDPAVDPPGTLPVWRGAPYYVTEEAPGLDTIGNVPFATRVDSLKKYLEWAPEASVSVIWSDGIERPDLVNGDKLEVTAKDGSKKEYYISILEYARNDNPRLGAITWPDITQDDKDFDFRWMGDTLPEFSPTKYQYNITLKYGTTNVPALRAISLDLNATVETKQAISLGGGFEERTTVFTVSAEQDSIKLVYAITFEVEKLPEHIQIFQGEPFISEFHHKYATTQEWLELCNPGNQELNLSEYLITWGLGTPAEVVGANLTYAQRYKMYVPGYKFTEDTAAWDINKYKILESDQVVNPILDPNGGVFVISGRNIQVNLNKFLWMSPDWWDISFPSDRENEWGIRFDVNTGIANSNAKDIVYYLFHIENDSILNGDKALGDVADLRLIDMMGYADGTWFANIGGYVWDGNKGHKLQRKSNIWQGNPDYTVSGGTTPENSEWTWANAQTEGIDWEEHISTIGSHALAPVTAYISTVSSLTYLVDEGYEGKLEIIGISNGETVKDFFGNLITPDPNQKLVLLGATDGLAKDSSAAVANGDSLVVTAVDGKTVTKYLLGADPLNSDTGLDPKDGSQLVVADGKISGFNLGTTLETVYTNVETISEFALLNIVDAAGALVPLKVLNFSNAYVPTLASESIWFEVIAQNGESMKYQLMPTSQASDAFVISGIYTVAGDNMTISDIPQGTNVNTFFSRIEAARGASTMLLNKFGQERMMGTMSVDDKLKVTSEDKSKTVVYYLNFIGETDPDYNQAPTAGAAFTDSTFNINTTISVTATVADDGMPHPGELGYEWTILSGDASVVQIVSPNSLTTDVTGLKTGSCVLQLIVDDGELSASTTVSLTVRFAQGIGSVSKAVVNMYPNPATDALTLDLMNLAGTETSVKIFSLTGQAVFNSITRSNRIQIDVSSFDAGIYFVHIEAGKESFTRKLNILR